MKRRAKGFTLVEIMIVVAIIGLLVAIALPNFMKARKKSQIKTAQASMKQIEGALEQFLLDGGTNTDADTISEMQDVLVSDYLKVWPVTPGVIGYGAATNTFMCTIPGIHGGNPFTAYDDINE